MPRSEGAEPQSDRTIDIRHGPSRQRVAAGVLAILTLLVGGSLLYHEQVAALEAWKGRLLAMADDRKVAVERWVELRVRTAQAISTFPTVRAYLDGAGTEASRLHAGEHVTEVVKGWPLLAGLGRTSVSLLDPSGQAALEIGGSLPARLAAEARSAPPDAVSTAFEEGRGVLLGAVARVTTPDGRREIGRVVVRFGPEDGLSEVLARQPLPTRTGETLVVRRLGDLVVSLGPVRFPAGAPAGMRVPWETPNLVSRRAAEGQETYGTFVDYRGHEVLAATRRVALTDWGLVVKVDRDEVLGAVRGQQAWTAFGLAGLLAAAALLFVASRQADRARAALELVRSEGQVARAEEALARTAEAYRRLFDRNPLPMYVFDLETLRFLAVNDATVARYGWSREELLGMTADDIRPPEDAPLVREAIRVTQGRGPQRLGVWRHLTRDGRLLHVEIDAHDLPFEGRPARIVLANDVTESRRALRELAESEERFRALFEDAPSPMVLADEDGRILRANRAAGEYLSRPSRELIGLTGDDIAHPDDRHLVRDALGALRAGAPTPMRIEARFLRADGGTIWADVSIHLVRAGAQEAGQLGRGARARPSGETPGFFIVHAVDVTEQRRAQAARLQALQDLERANEELEGRVRERTAELEAFMYSVSHDLRAPLRAVDGFSRILQEEHAATLGPEAARLVRVVREGAQGMGRLVEDLLALSRIARKDLRRSAVDVEALVAGEMEALIPPAARSRVSVKIGSLPPVEADPGLARQVFSNLIGNAVKFSSQRERAKIEVWAEPGDPTVYRVRDNGVGFDMADAGRLFGVFSRLHGPPFEGTGVGLAIVERIVRRHGGWIRAEGAPDGGATFSFTLASGSRSGAPS